MLRQTDIIVHDDCLHLLNNYPGDFEETVMIVTYTIFGRM